MRTAQAGRVRVCAHHPISIACSIAWPIAGPIAGPITGPFTGLRAVAVDDVLAWARPRSSPRGVEG